MTIDTLQGPVAKNLQIERHYTLFLMAFAFAMIPFAAFAPRFMAFAPALIGLVGLVGWPFVYSGRPALPKKTVLIVFGILFLGAISSLWSVEPSFSLERIGKIALVLFGGCAFLSLALSMNASVIGRYLWLLPVSLGFAVVLNLIEVGFDMPLHRLLRGVQASEELSGALVNRSIVCVVAALFVALSVVWFHGKWSAYKFYLSGGLIGAVVLMLSLSEGQSSQLAFVVGLCVFFLFPYTYKKAWIFLGIIVSALIITAPWTVQYLFGHYAASLHDMAWFSQGYAAYRLEIWDFIARYVLDSPMLGYGLDATRHITDFESATLYHPSNHILHPHNFALQIWIEFGVLGVFALCGFLTFMIFKALQRPLYEARMALATLVGLISIAATGYGLWQGWWLGEIMFVLSVFVLVTRGLGAIAAAKE